MSMTINNFEGGGEYLLHELDDIDIVTDSSSVTVELKLSEEWGVNETTLMKETYYPYLGKVSINDIRTPIANAMRERGCSLATLYLELTEDTGGTMRSARVIFASIDRGLTFAQLCSSYFLSSYMAKVISDTSLTETVSFIASAAYTVKVTCIGVDDEGSVLRRETSTASDTVTESKVFSYSFCPADFLAAWQSADDTVVAIRAITVSVGDRHVTYYIASDRINPALQLKFRNEYNAIECISLLGVTTRKTSGSHEVAKCGHNYIAYDHSVSQEFEFESGALTSYPRNSVESLLCAKDVWIREDAETDRSIIITDVTSELTNSIGDVDTVKFSYQYANDVPVLPMKKKGVSVYSNEYDSNFG